MIGDRQLDRIARHTADLPVGLKLAWLMALSAGLTALMGVVAMLATGWVFAADHARKDAQEVARSLAFASLCSGSSGWPRRPVRARWARSASIPRSPRPS